MDNSNGPKIVVRTSQSGSYFPDARFLKSLRRRIARGAALRVFILSEPSRRELAIWCNSVARRVYRRGGVLGGGRR